MPRSSTQYIRNNLSAAVVLLIAGCASSGGTPTRLDINSSVPVPLVEKLPVTAGVVFSKALTEYTTIETPTKGRSWEISLGSSNRRVLQDILESLFDRIIVVDSAAGEEHPDTEVDLTIVPTVDDYSMLTAGESGSKFYAVSMRHFLDIYKPDGDLVGRLEINSYGRSKAAKFTRGSNEIDVATDDAFRDLAVTLLVELPNKLEQAGLIPQQLIKIDEDDTAE